MNLLRENNKEIVAFMIKVKRNIFCYALRV